MSGNRSEQEQPRLWDDELPTSDRTEPPQWHKPPATTAAAPTRTPGAPQRSTPTPPAPQTHAELDVNDLWDADRVAAYLGVPRQTLYAWRHSGKGPQGFRVGKHLRWHARTVVEWTLALERGQ